MDWDDLQKREKEFMKGGKHNLRHNISSAGVSDIAGQFFCEYKVENAYTLGEVPTEATSEGTSFHDELIPQKPISREGFIKLVKQKKPTFAVLRVWGKLGDIQVIGMPDHIVWNEERPRWLVELKTTKGDPTTLWPDQRAQVVIYGALLEKMGFDCSDLQLAVVRVKAKDLSDEEKMLWVMLVSKHLAEGRIEELEAAHKGKMKVYVLKHDVAEAETAVRAMQGYWLKEREPYSSTSLNKCLACAYRDQCPKSLTRSA
ncbi:MAG: PD-(D/E)XK nuclease family protein [Nitrososphaerota archaeon]|nr:PD-(D/E)XK nuclease family protein [Nitrososphaerota archaeon]